jgi:hypothetical protein
VYDPDEFSDKYASEREAHAKTIDKLAAVMSALKKAEDELGKERDRCVDAWRMLTEERSMTDALMKKIAIYYNAPDDDVARREMIEVWRFIRELTK